MIQGLFKKEKVPELIPVELDRVIKKFSVSGNKEDFLEKAFYYTVNRWDGGREGLILKINRLFDKDFNKTFNKRGYMPCTKYNLLLRIMLLKSGFLKESDIELENTNSWYIVPHQYLKVRLSKGESLNLDPWSYRFGVDYGEYASGFKSTNFKPIR
jgi:hypothetical protein